MTFIVNGADWQFDTATGEEIAQSLDRFLDFACLSKERGEEIKLGEDFHVRPMRDNLTLWDLFSDNAGLELPREIEHELAAYLNSANYYINDNDWPDGAEHIIITIGSGLPVENVDIAWTHHCVRAGRSIACFTLREPAVNETRTVAGSAAIHFVANDATRRKFWRDEIVRQGDNINSLQRLAAHAFPDIYFVDGVLRHLERLAGGYLSLRERIRTTLAVLDDRGHWIFTCPPPAIKPDEVSALAEGGKPTNQLVEKRFVGLGLNAAPENPNVRLDSKCREARETTLGGRKLYCEWHIKLERHRNRIYIHPPTPESKQKLVIGMIVEHLPLPG